MIRLTTLLALMICVMTAQAQKIDQRLTLLAQQVVQHRAQGIESSRKTIKNRIAVGYDEHGDICSVSVQAYLKQGAACPTELLEQQGITVRFVIDNVAVLSVPIEKLSVLEHIDEILYAKADLLQQPYNDVSRTVTHVDQIADATKAAAAGLPQYYTGKGVVVGIVDAGIDFQHAAFRDAQGNYRYKQVVMFKSEDGKADVYNTVDQFKTLDFDTPGHSHGTHTASIAAGSDHGNGLQGMAPEADIILVSMDNTSSESNMADGIRRIAKYAADNNKPCVINLSMGVTNDLHDGSSLVCKAVKEVTDNGQKEGIAVCIATGNAAAKDNAIIHTLGTAGSDGYQLRAIIGNDINFNVDMMDEVDARSLHLDGNTTHDLPEEEDPRKPSYNGLSLIVYAADDNPFTAELKIVDIETGAIIDDWTGVNDGDPNGTGVTKPVKVTLMQDFQANARNTATCVWKPDYQGDILLANKNHRLAVFVKGNEGQVIKLIQNNDEAKEPNFFIPEKLKASGLYTAGTSVLSNASNNCDESVISVGSTVSRNEWKYYQSGDKTAQQKKSSLTGAIPKIGDISDFSSYCLQDDNGKSYPTVVAPGECIFAAFSMNYPYHISPKTEEPYNDVKNEFSPESQQLISEQHINTFGRKNWYGNYWGTSMACPHVAGIIALWMQANPKLSVNRIKEVLKETCTKLTAAQCPSKHIEQAGYGQIDALAGLKKVITMTGIENIAADRHPAKDASFYNLMGQKVNGTQKGLVIYKGRKFINK